MFQGLNSLKVDWLIDWFDCIPDEFPSDHLLMKFCLSIPRRRLKSVKRVVYNYKKADIGRAPQLTSECPLGILPWERWPKLFCSKMDWFVSSLRKQTAAQSNRRKIRLFSQANLFLTTVETVVPKIRIRATNSAPWIDAAEVRKKERWRRKAKRSGSNEYHWEKCRRFRASVKATIKRKRKEYFKSLSTSIQDNPKRFWAFYQAKYKSKRIPNTVYFKEKRATNPKHKSELFNAFFNSVFKDDHGDPLLEEIWDCDTTDDSVLSNITLHTKEVRETLSQLKPVKDLVPARLLKDCADEISPSLCKLLNILLSAGHFPLKYMERCCHCADF